MYRQEFLSQLLSTENIVQADGAQEECMICSEVYGTMSTETGKVERQIRLPCDTKHTVGSDCIAKWLEEHNTCPVCRHEFFPARGPYYDDEDGWRRWVGNLEPDSDWDSEEYDSEDAQEEEYDADPTSIYGAEPLINLCHLLCNAIGFERDNHPVKRAAALVVSGILHLSILQDASPFSNFSIAAACVYAAGHLCGRRRAMWRIVRVWPIRERSVRDVYRRVIYEESHTRWIRRDLVELIHATSRMDAWRILPEPKEMIRRR
ncbi:hypothetical protein HO173_000104 [Letharia columbiana]|uniref:RING-type domain-containing protein n=1 Tax=Letharia columbiana TaxID=112416 RepID=A0A8H6LAD1_9LECA|nr:uncharacterized protein HO173_000104 [Letharia columbiana]KAF6241394.1 hypothetical protein HO173_000104 [Letharia columbiana]